MSDSVVFNRRFSDRNLKRKNVVDESEANKKKVRSCDKVGCLLPAPTCCLLASDSCSVSGYTSRWYHLSLGEHFCNNCFDNFYRSGKPGYRLYSSWSNEWANTARAVKPTIKRFISNQLLPYWIKCIECGKWRMVRKEGTLDQDFIGRFKCDCNIEKETDSNSKKKTDSNSKKETDCSSKKGTDSNSKKGIDSNSKKGIDSNSKKGIDSSSKKETDSNSKKETDSNSKKETDSNSKKETGCDYPEDENVAEAKNASWMMELVEEPLLKRSPAGYYLKRFLSEDIGLCPIDCSEPVFKEIENIEPFYVGQCGESSIWVKPDALEEDEAEFAKEALIFSPAYLGLRNLIVTVWNMSPTEWLTLKHVEKYIICRGLVRIYLVTIAEQIIDLLTKKSVINYGIIPCPLAHRILKDKTEKVVVIGAGISGLAAAKHLSNLGINVTVLEASSRPLGRIYQDTLIESDAIFVQGLTNNPFTIMALQAKKKFYMIETDFIVFKHTGEQVPLKITERVDHELYGLIHGAIEWASLNNQDSDCYSTVMKNYQEMSKVSLNFRDSENFSLFLSQFEIEQRADLKDLSLLSWEFVTEMGYDGIMPEGLHLLTNKLTEDLTISYNSEVKAIDYTSDEIRISTTDQEVTASYVLSTVPVSCLRSNQITFNPPLPEVKTDAINALGDYYCEKLLMEFPKRFWTRKIKEPFGKFSVVSPEKLFFLFIDVTQNKKNSTPTLLTYISQDSLKKTKKLKDEVVVDQCMSLLREVFSCDGAVPKPTKWLLTHWSDETFGGSFGTYVKVGGTQSSYDHLAETVKDKIYFAGEATFRNMPSTITGAYLSGLREAAKIVKHLEGL